MKQTLVQQFQESARKYPKGAAILAKKLGKYQPVTYSTLRQEVEVFARGLLALGVKKGERVAILSENRAEWIIADLANLHIGAVTVAMFPVYPAEQVRYIISDCQAELIVVSGKSQLEKVISLKESIPKLRTITMDCSPDPSRDVLSFDRVLELGRECKISDEEFRKNYENILGDDLVTIIYTSGTTGEPKGAMLTHKNFISNIEASLEVIPFKPGEVVLAVLPFNHVLPRMADIYTPLAVGCTIAINDDYARLKDNAREVKPNYVTLVPRFFEMIEEAIKKAIEAQPVARRRIIGRAMEYGRKRAEYIQHGMRVPLPLLTNYFIYDKLVLSKIRAQMGMQRLKNFISGGSPLSIDCAEFFASLGMVILEGYGLTETSPVTNVNPPRRFKFGTVGPPLRNVEVRIAEDGEILVRGPNVMLGYFNKPKETSEAIDDDGWFHTGDLGKLDNDGYLRITDRKKDIIVLASGKKVAPQAIEKRLCQSPYIANAVLWGDEKATVTALIELDWDEVRRWAQTHGVPLNADDPQTAVNDENLKELVKNEIRRLSEGLADFEKIHRFRILPDKFSVETGELTPTMKVRRRLVYERYRALIEEMYQ